MNGTRSDKTLLSIETLTLHYGSAQALFGVDLCVAEGETVAIVGANGAGKSSLLKAITGLVPPSGGRIVLDGRDVTGRPPSHMVSLGVALAPEGREVFGDLTVRRTSSWGLWPASRTGRSASAGWRRSSADSRSLPGGRSSPPPPSRGASSRWWPSAGP